MSDSGLIDSPDKKVNYGDDGDSIEITTVKVGVV
jgi:hypothetical protein